MAKLAKTNCGHIEFLGAFKPFRDARNKTPGRFLDFGHIITFATGEAREAPVLRFLRSGRDGRLTAGPEWLEVKHCPVCGEAVWYEDTQPAPRPGA